MPCIDACSCIGAWFLIFWTKLFLKMSFSSFLWDYLCLLTLILEHKHFYWQLSRNLRKSWENQKLSFCSSILFFIFICWFCVCVFTVLCCCCFVLFCFICLFCFLCFYVCYVLYVFWLFMFFLLDSTTTAIQKDPGISQDPKSKKDSKMRKNSSTRHQGD